MASNVDARVNASPESGIRTVNHVAIGDRPHRAVDPVRARRRGHARPAPARLVASAVFGAPVIWSLLVFGLSTLVGRF
jgi:hypothetical protein